MPIVADAVDLVIESLNVAGDGLARHRRQVVVVPFTIPGEQVRVRLGPPRAGARAAELVEVIRPSPHRVAPVCRHFGPGAESGHACGGCSWQHIDYAEQLRMKTSLVTRLVRDVVPAAPPAHAILTPGADAPWHYRQKVHFVVATDRAGRFVMGHYARFSRHIVPVRECPVHDPRGNGVAFALRNACQRAGARSVKGIVVRAGCSTRETMATIVVDDDTDTRVRTACRRALEGDAAPSSLHVNLHPRGDRFVFGRQTRHLAGPERLREDLGGASFLISPTAFFQTNVRVAEMLVQAVLAAVPTTGARVLDLYAGAGLFALPLAKRGHEVVAVEDNTVAVADGKASLRLSRVPEGRCRYAATTVEAALGRQSRLTALAFDAVVLDPPRQGCAKPVIEAVFGGIRPATAVYVSCEPESLARDLGRIAALGYAIESLQPLDMFPHTPHIETVAVVRRG